MAFGLFLSLARAYKHFFNLPKHSKSAEKLYWFKNT